MLPRVAKELELAVFTRTLLSLPLSTRSLQRVFHTTVDINISILPDFIKFPNYNHIIRMIVMQLLRAEL